MSPEVPTYIPPGILSGTDVEVSAGVPWGVLLSIENFHSKFIQEFLEEFLRISPAVYAIIYQEILFNIALGISSGICPEGPLGQESAQTEEGRHALKETPLEDCSENFVVVSLEFLCLAFLSRNPGKSVRGFFLFLHVFLKRSLLLQKFL